jgi:hypothetical protein
MCASGCTCYKRVVNRQVLVGTMHLLQKGGESTEWISTSFFIYWYRSTHPIRIPEIYCTGTDVSYMYHASPTQVGVLACACARRYASPCTPTQRVRATFKLRVIEPYMSSYVCIVCGEGLACELDYNAHVCDDLPLPDFDVQWAEVDASVGGLCDGLLGFDSGVTVPPRPRSGPDEAMFTLTHRGCYLTIFKGH